MQDVVNLGIQRFVGITLTLRYKLEGIQTRSQFFHENVPASAPLVLEGLRP